MYWLCSSSNFKGFFKLFFFFEFNKEFVTGKVLETEQGSWSRVYLNVGYFNLEPLVTARMWFIKHVWRVVLSYTLRSPDISALRLDTLSRDCLKSILLSKWPPVTLPLCLTSCVISTSLWVTKFAVYVSAIHVSSRHNNEPIIARNIVLCHF